MQTDIRSSQKQITTKRKEIEKVESQIAQKQAELNQAETEEQRKAREGLESTRELLKRLQDEVPRKERRLDELKIQLDTMGREVDDFGVKANAASQEIKGRDERIAGLRRQAGNRLAAFGTGLDPALKAIRTAKWGPNGQGRHPIGPMGMHVNLLDPMYTDVMSAIMGGVLCSFVVFQQGDASRLMKILEGIPAYKAGSGGARRIPPIITNSGDRFDYSKGDTSRFGQTMLSKLKIDDEDVLRVLINQFHIERTFISQNDLSANAELDEVIKRGLPGAEFVTATCSRQRGQGQPGGQGLYTRGTEPIEMWKGNLLFSRDMEGDIRKLDSEKAKAQEALNHWHQEHAMAKERRQAKQVELDKVDQDWRKARGGVTGAERKINQLENLIEERPDDAIAGLELARAELQSQLDGRQVALEELEKDLPELKEAIRRLKEESDDLEKQYEDFGPEQQKRSAVLIAVTDGRDRAKKDVEQWTRSHGNWAERLDAKKADHERTVTELAVRTPTTARMIADVPLGLDEQSYRVGA